MKKRQKNTKKEIIEGESIIGGLTIHPSTISNKISEKTRGLVGKVAEFNWFHQVEGDGIPENSPPDKAYKNKGWEGWIDFMGYERMLYEIEELKRRHGSG